MGCLELAKTKDSRVASSVLLRVRGDSRATHSSVVEATSVSRAVLARTIAHNIHSAEDCSSRVNTGYQNASIKMIAHASMSPQ